MLKILLLVIALLLFSGCTPKIEYVYLTPEKHTFSIPTKVDPITVDVKENELVEIEKESVVVEVATYTRYIKLLRAKIENLVSQIEDYRKEK